MSLQGHSQSFLKGHDNREKVLMTGRKMPFPSSKEQEGGRGKFQVRQAHLNLWEGE